MTARVVVMDDMGDIHAPRGSRAWAIAMKDRLHMQVKDTSWRSENLTSDLTLFEQAEGWRVLPDANGELFRSYTAFVEERWPFGLGYRRAELDRYIADRKSAEERARTATPLREESGRPVANDSVRSIRSPRGGENADYLTARIARDNPAILERMQAGEFKSVRAAAKEAGLVRPTVRIPTDEPIAAARLIRRHMSDDHLAALILALQSDPSLEEGA